MSALNLNIMKKEQLLQKLKDDGNTEDLSGLTRPELINKIRGVQVAKVIESAVLEEDAPQAVNQEVVSAPIKTKQEKVIEEIIPTLGSAGWTDYLVGLLDDEDKVKNAPTCNGVRKLFERFIGEIAGVNMDVLQCPTPENAGRAVVKCMVSYFDLNGVTKYISDVADCYFGNTKAPYNTHPTSTAATMAEGRCYRKGLRMNVLTQEETQGPVGQEAKEANDLEESQRLANDTQKNAVTRLSAKMGIDVNKLLENEQLQTKTLDGLTTIEVQGLLRVLNSYQKPIINGGQAIPDSIKLVNT